MNKIDQLSVEGLRLINELLEMDLDELTLHQAWEVPGNPQKPVKFLPE